MRKHIIFFMLIVCAVLNLQLLQAQSTTEMVKDQVNKALQQHVKKIYPPKGCEFNDSAHFYTSKFKFTKNQQVGNTLRLWGRAGVTYRNARTGGKRSVEFYTEVIKKDGEVEVTKLKWRAGPCMKFEPLYQK